MISLRGNILRTTARWGMYGAFATWLGLSIFQQADRPHRLALRIDPTAMAIPNWRFFAPRPATFDYSVLYRDRLPDGALLPWREEKFSVDRTLAHTMWHPARRMEKALFDAASELVRIAGDLGDIERIQLSVPYLALLNYVTRQVTHDPAAVEVQFLLAQSAGFDDTVEPRLVFLSDFHALSERGAASSDSPAVTA